MRRLTAHLMPLVDDFGWHAETRLGASCQLNQHWRFDAAWRWFIAGPHYDSLNSMVFTAPNFDLVKGDPGSIDRSDVFLGFSYTR